MLQNTNSEVKFHCPDIEDKLKMKKFSGPSAETFFFRKEFESIVSKCHWSEEQGVTQLQRALCGPALQEFLDKQPYETTQQSLDMLQNHYVGADAHRRYHQRFRTAKQKQGQSLETFLTFFTKMVHCANALAPTPQDIISPREQMLAFLDSLSDDLQQFTNLEVAQSMAEAIDKAQRAEASLKLQKKAKRSSDQAFPTREKNKYQKKSKFEQLPKRSKVICDHCIKIGHVQEQCFSLHPELKTKGPKQGVLKGTMHEIHELDRSRFELPVDINGKPVSILLDTGATDTVIIKSFVII